jgi:hypothetical protein
MQGIQGQLNAEIEDRDDGKKEFACQNDRIVLFVLIMLRDMQRSVLCSLSQIQ